MTVRTPRMIGVVGAGSADADLCETARRVGELVARRGAAVVCGGLGGVMEAACRGAVEAGGVTIGILPGDDREAANEWVVYPIVTDAGHARNVFIAQTAYGLVAVAGEYGTLSEIAVALKLGKPVVAVESQWWSIPGVIRCATPDDAVATLFDALEREGG